MFDERSSPLGPREIPGVEFNIKSPMYGVEAYIAMIFEKIYNNLKSDSLDLFREDKKYIIFLGSGISAEVFGYEDIVIEVTEVLKRHSEYKDKIIYIIDNDYPEELKEKIKEKFMDFFNGGAEERKKLNKQTDPTWPHVHARLKCSFDEFINIFKDKVNPQTFNGDVSQFKKFGSIVDNYFII